MKRNYTDRKKQKKFLHPNDFRGLGRKRWTDGQKEQENSDKREKETYFCFEQYGNGDSVVGEDGMQEREKSEME